MGVKAVYILRVLTLLLAGAVFGGTVWMWIIFKDYHNVIVRWKFRAESVVACITFIAYFLAMFTHRPGRIRSKGRAETYLILGCLLGAAWLHTSIRIIARRERQVVPVDNPYTDRNSISSWSDYHTRYDYSLFECDVAEDPNSSMGATKSFVLCLMDQICASLGVIVGVLVIVESCVTYSVDKRIRRQDEQLCNDYSLGHNPAYTTTVVPPSAVVVAPAPVGYAAHTAAGPEGVPLVQTYNPYESTPMYHAREGEIPPLDGDKKTKF